MAVVGTGRAQTMSQIHYAMTSIVKGHTEEGKTVGMATLNYDNYVYIDGKRSISVSKPGYLDDFPSGYVEYTPPKGNGLIQEIPMDTLQDIYYVSADSGIIRKRYLFGQMRNFIDQDTAKWDNWILTDETKTINGVVCKKAKRPMSQQGKETYVWYDPKTPVSVGPFWIQNPPGLIYFAHLHYGTEYTLLEYNSHVALDKTVFWPKEFNEKFRKETPPLTQEQLDKILKSSNTDPNVKVSIKID